MQFTIKRDVSNIADSMLLPSGTVICELVGVNGLVYIEVEGEVNVEFEGNTYGDPIEFPTELKELFESGKADDDPRVCIDSNNWFSIFYAENPERPYYVTESDTIDCSNYSPKELFECCMDFYEYMTDDDVFIDYRCKMMKEGKN